MRRLLYLRHHPRSERQTTTERSHFTAWSPDRQACADCPDGINLGGTAFKLDPSGTFTILHNLWQRHRWKYLYSGLVRGQAGNLYGTTWGGGAYGKGTVFKLDASGHETILHNFHGEDGANPV